MQIFKTLITPLDLVELAKKLCSLLWWEEWQGMFTTALWVDNITTHYISTWFISDKFALLLSDPNILYSVCLENWINVSLKECEDLILLSDITEEEPLSAIARLWLSIIYDLE